MNRRTVSELLEKADGMLGSVSKDDPSYDLILGLIKDVKKILPDIQGELNSYQEEVCKKLEVAVGPGKLVVLTYNLHHLVEIFFLIILNTFDFKNLA